MPLLPLPLFGRHTSPALHQINRPRTVSAVRGQPNNRKGPFRTVSSPIITGPARILQKWRGRRNHDELPIVQLDPVMTDDDVDFHNDMLYFRSLLDDVKKLCQPDTRLEQLDACDSTLLDVALELVLDDAPWAIVA